MIVLALSLRASVCQLSLSAPLLAQQERVPNLEGVKSILEREFGGLFTLNGEMLGLKLDPLYVAGDFNGDGRPDLAVLVKVSTEHVVRRLAENPGWFIPGLDFEDLDQGNECSLVQESADRPVEPRQRVREWRCAPDFTWF